MSIPAPHFLLFSEAHSRNEAASEWRFVLESLDGQKRIAAADREMDTHGERIELLAVVRGLEALGQPSRVILITNSRYVSRGLERGLGEWRESGWRWERFGRRVPVRDADLWQRIDRAMHFHQVECRTWRFDHEHVEPRQKLERKTDRGSHDEQVATTDGEDPTPDVLIVRNRPRHVQFRKSFWASIASWWRWFWHVPSVAPMQ